MKVIIPVAGTGTQLRPLTYTQPKPLIPVAGKPILSHILDSFMSLGFEDFVFVTGYMGEKIKIFLDERYPKIHKEFAFQSSREGLGHAIWLAGEYFKNEKDVLVILGDTIIDMDWERLLSTTETHIGVHRVEDPRNFGVVETDAFGQIQKFIEKPKIPKSNLGITGLYKFSDGKVLFDALERLIQSGSKTHGEYQLTDGLQIMLDAGHVMSTIEVENWYDCGRKDILLETNARKLRERATSHASEFPSSILVPPVSIGKGCEITNSIIGPNVSIGGNTKVKNSILQNSIIGSFSRLESVCLDSSIIGQDVSIAGLYQSLNIGDNTEIDFSSSGRRK